MSTVPNNLSHLQRQLAACTRELRASEARFHNVITRAADGMVIVDRHGTVRFVNAAAEALFRRTASELLGQPFGHPLLANETTELDIVRRDGEPIVVEMRVVETEWEGAAAWVASLRDITAHKRTEATLTQQALALSRANAELQNYAYVASHDLQEPLRTIVGFLRLLQRQYQERLDAEADEYIALAVEGATRMQQLIQDLLVYARLDTQSQTLTPVDCDQLLHDVLAALHTSLTETRAVVTADRLPTVVGNATQLGQVFQNLLGNSLKFRGEEPPHIHIAATLHDTMWQFTVQDNGLGIAPQHAERIFTIFQRLHTTTEYPGTGIGLAICQKVIEAHGGRIWADSVPPKGTVISFTLPRVKNLYKSMS